MEIKHKGRGAYDYWAVKIDSVGNKQGDKRFGGTGDDRLTALQQTQDGGYILGGWSESDSGGDKTQPSWGGTIDFWIIKINVDMRTFPNGLYHVELITTDRVYRQTFVKE